MIDDETKEQKRQERLERIYREVPQVQRADVFFDFDHATEKHRETEAVRLFRLAQGKHGE